MRKHILPILMILGFVSTFAYAQTTEDQIPVILVPENVGQDFVVRIIVDGQQEGDADTNDHLICLHRAASEFTFDDMSFGNSNVAVSHIQVYNYDGGHLIGESSLLNYYNAADRWLGFFRHPTDTVDIIAVDADWQIDDRLIIRSEESQTLKELSVNDANTISVKTFTP